MKKECPEDVDAVLWNALEWAFWSYAIQMKGSGSATEKLTQVVTDFLDFLKDQEVCYDDE